MVQSPSLEANWFAASQEIPHISGNPKVHYRTHKRPPPVSILSQPNPVHIPTFHFLQIHPNIVHPSTPRSPQWSPSLRFLQQDPRHPPLLTNSRHMPSPSHSFYSNINIKYKLRQLLKCIFNHISRLHVSARPPHTLPHLLLFTSLKFNACFILNFKSQYFKIM